MNKANIKDISIFLLIRSKTQVIRSSGARNPRVFSKNLVITVTDKNYQINQRILSGVNFAAGPIGFLKFAK